MKNLHNHNIVHEVDKEESFGEGVVGNQQSHTHDIINHHEPSNKMK
jgi:hypothetical protein